MAIDIGFSYGNSNYVSLGGSIYGGDPKMDGLEWQIHLPVVPARDGAEAALDLTTRPFSSIELACAVRRARVLCAKLLCC